MRAIVTITTVLLVHFSFAQDPNYFIEKLKDNSDQQVLTRAAIQDSLHKLDTTTLVQLLDEIKKETAHSSRKLKARVTAVISRALFYWLGPGDSVYASQMKDALYAAYELDEPFMVAEYNRWYSEMLNTLRKKEDAVQYGLTALRLQETLGIEHFRSYYSFCLEVGEMFYRNRNMNEAITYFNKGLRGALDEKFDPRAYANSLNTLGVTYKYLEKYDSSLMAFVRCMEYSKANHIDDWYYLASDNRFDDYIELKQYDSCYVIAQGLYDEGIKTDDSTLLMPAYFMLGRIATRQGQFQKAIPLLLKSQEYSVKVGYRPNSVKIFKDLATCYDSTGRPDLASIYFRSYLQLKDTLDHRDMMVNSNYLFAKANFEQEQLKFEKLKAQKEKGILFRDIGIISLVVISVLALWWLNRRRKKAIQLQATAEKQLDFFKEEMIARNRQIETLNAEMQSQEHSAEKAAKVEELSRQIILTEDDWQQFQSMFNKVYPGFFHRLRDKAVGITEAELRLSSLIKIQLSTKQVAAMQGISADAVHKTRQRLRQRFSIASTSELEAIIHAV